MTARDLLDLAWVIPAIPALGAVVLLLFGKRIGEPRAGWLATGLMALTFIASVVTFLALFSIGAVGLLVRRNTLVMFMCIELMLNAANLTFVTFAKALDDIGGQAIVFFTLVVAAAEVAVGLAIIVAIFRRRQNVTADDVNILEG